MDWWVVAAVANMVILVAYLMISLKTAGALIKTRQSVRDNPLAWATAAIFFTCAVHHGGHPAHQLLPALGADVHIGEAMRAAFNEWHVAFWDIITAAVGIWYWRLRGRLPALVRGAALFEDVRERQQQALEIHDNVVQGLTTAKLAFETGHEDQGMRSVERTLHASRKIITDLLGDSADGTLQPGELRRSRPAGS